MVDSISQSAAKLRLLRSDNEPGAVGGKSASVSGARSSGASSFISAGDQLSISPAAKGLPEELRLGPPVDIETVEKIKEAIEQNRYPIDLKAITESLFQSFLEVSR